MAPEGRRGALTGVFYTTAYLGFAGPFVVTSVAERTGTVLPLGVAAAVVGGLGLRLLAPARSRRL